MSNHNKDSELVDEKQALTQFFNSLLKETTETSIKEQKIEMGPEKGEFKTETDVNETVFLPIIPIEVSEQTINQNNSNITDVSNKKSSKLKIESIDSRTATTEEAFQIMMFKTAGLTLAVPLVELSGVITWPENITEMPGHKDSYLGIVQHLGKKIPIIDIAQIVFPQDRLVSLTESNSTERLQRIVFINDFEWGLACDAVNDVITIEPTQIKWRKSGTKRAWLAGTVVEHMCALLDTKELSKLLNSNHC
ncbi:MAG: chemotaxis protein CheW [Thiohalomonadales bacterium]